MPRLLTMGQRRRYWQRAVTRCWVWFHWCYLRHAHMTCSASPLGAEIHVQVQIATVQVFRWCRPRRALMLALLAAAGWLSVIPENMGTSGLPAGAL